MLRVKLSGPGTTSPPFRTQDGPCLARPTLIDDCDARPRIQGCHRRCQQREHHKLKARRQGLPVEKPRPETTSLRDFASFRHVTQVSTSSAKVSLINHYVQSLCGLYSRIARQLQVDRSYVSRVARGERRSEPIERALVTEFERITAEEAP